MALNLQFAGQLGSHALSCPFDLVSFCLHNKSQLIKFKDNVDKTSDAKYPGMVLA